MEIKIVAGGPDDHLPILEDGSGKAIWVGVDKGVVTLLAKGITPRIAFGDFDSVTKEEMNWIEKQVPEIRKFKPEKDKTDMELALDWAIKQNPEKIRILGGTGGRLDHFFANVHLLLKPELKNAASQIEMIDNRNIIFVKEPGTYTIEKMASKKYVSFVPLTSAVKGLTLKGFRYELSNCELPIGSTLCISNELADDRGTFSFSDGILMVVRSSD